jgi:hypothetical protein
MSLDASRVLRDSEYTLNTASHAACDTANRATDGPTNRTGRTVADSSAFLCPTHDSLSLNGGGHGENGEADCGK